MCVFSLKAMCSLRVLVVTIIININCAITVITDNVAFPCTTPDEESAFCISLFSCPGLLKSVGTLDPSAIKYLKLSICLGCKAGDFMVCCGQANLQQPNDKLRPSVNISKATSTSSNIPIKQDKGASPISDRRYCGLQHTDDRYYNNPVTALDEFPWLVHIKFTDIYSEYKLGDRCTGVLINNRYVLTDTICARNALKVRLGQYDVAQKITCFENPQAHECSEGTIEVKVEKKIGLQPGVIEVYSLTLIRLADTVDFTDFVRPICLPTREEYRPNKQIPLTFSGWGAKPQTSIREDAIKKRLVYHTTQIDDCAQANPNIKKYMEENALPLNCFYPKKENKDSACFGDHGGPLMYSDQRHQWYVEHVIVEVGYGEGLCGKNNTAVAVRITPEIIDKIIENIEP